MEQRYIISDAAKKIDVEAHVLRYWEEELELKILRNEMGHRYYREQDILLFSEIKELKEKGIQLKAIKSIIPDIKEKGENCLEKLFSLQEDDKVTKQTILKNIKDKDELSLEENGAIIMTEKNTTQLSALSNEEKMHQFEMILKNIVNEALVENNAELGKEVSLKVTDSVIKEMDYLFRLQDEKEEERYKKMDEMIRHYQKRRREVALTTENDKKKKKEGFFKKKNKVSMETY